MNIDPAYYCALFLACYTGLLISLIVYATEYDRNSFLQKMAIFLAILMLITPLCVAISNEVKEERWVKDNCKRIGIVTIGKDGPTEQYDCGDKQYKRE